MLSDLMRRHGTLAWHCTDSSGWSDDYRLFYIFLEAITVDPFHPSIVEDAGGSSGVDIVDNYLLGRDCKMNKKEWRHFCQEVLMLKAMMPQTLDAVVAMVDDVLVTIVRGVVGCAEFLSAPGGKLMKLVVALARFLLLCGQSGVFPHEYALGLFRATRVFDGSKRPLDGGVCVFSQKVTR